MVICISKTYTFSSLRTTCHANDVGGEESKNSQKYEGANSQEDHGSNEDCWLRFGDDCLVIASTQKILGVFDSISKARANSEIHLFFPFNKPNLH